MIQINESLFLSASYFSCNLICVSSLLHTEKEHLPSPPLRSICKDDGVPRSRLDELLARLEFRRRWRAGRCAEVRLIK